MSQYSKAPISSIKAIKSTIETDALVFRWFLYLITQEKVKRDLTAESQDNKVYDRLKIIIVAQTLSSIVLFGLLIYVVISREFIFLSAVAIIFLITFTLQQAVRRHVSRISYRLIAQHFKPADLGKNTLYQIGEFFAEKYKIKSLVMAMTSIDVIIRKVLLYSIVFALFIFPLAFFPTWVLVLIVYWMTSAIINTSVVYKHL